jgi:hypothetical protein
MICQSDFPTCFRATDVGVVVPWDVVLGISSAAQGDTNLLQWGTGWRSDMVNHLYYGE